MGLTHCAKKNYSNMTKDEIVSDYLKGKINLTEARKLLDKLEGKRLVDLIDGVNPKNKHEAL